jgi:hypothetical protein
MDDRNWNEMGTLSSYANKQIPPVSYKNKPSPSN